MSAQQRCYAWHDVGLKSDVHTEDAIISHSRMLIPCRSGLILSRASTLPYIDYIATTLSGGRRSVGLSVLERGVVACGIFRMPVF